MGSWDLTHGLTVPGLRIVRTSLRLTARVWGPSGCCGDGRNVACGLGAGVKEFPVTSALITVPTVPVFLGLRSFPGCGAFWDEKWKVLGKTGQVGHSNFNVPGLWQLRSSDVARTLSWGWEGCSLFKQPLPGHCFWGELTAFLSHSSDAHSNKGLIP